MAAFVTNDYLSLTAVGVDNSRAVENWAPFGVINLPNGTLYFSDAISFRAGCA